MKASLRGLLASGAAMLLAACTNSSSQSGPGSTAGGAGSATASAGPTPSAAPTPAQLPGGGTTIFPRYRVVAYYGAAGVPAMGVLGQGPPEAAAAKLLTQARAYAPYGRPVMPALELIATVAQQASGGAGMYSGRTDDASIARYLAAARRVHALLILDIQPGYRSFLGEARHYENFLIQPDVELALDSEWSMSGGEIPGKTIGHTTGAVVNGVSQYLAQLVATHHLPQKILAVHLFVPEMVTGMATIVPRPGLAITFHADGFGGRAVKRSHYRELYRKPPFYNGFKLFYQQDIAIFAPGDVMQLHPPPDLVTYE